jgi:hypothetical protein
MTGPGDTNTPAAPLRVFDYSPYIEQGEYGRKLPIEARYLWLASIGAAYAIETEPVEGPPNTYAFRAYVRVEVDGVITTATAYGSEEIEQPDAYERAETRAVSRALARLGFDLVEAKTETEPRAVVDGRDGAGPSTKAVFDAGRAKGLDSAGVGAIATRITGISRIADLSPEDKTRVIEAIRRGEI